MHLTMNKLYSFKYSSKQTYHSFTNCLDGYFDLFISKCFSSMCFFSRYSLGKISWQRSHFQILFPCASSMCLVTSPSDPNLVLQTVQLKFFWFLWTVFTWTRKWVMVCLDSLCFWNLPQPIYTIILITFEVRESVVWKILSTFHTD